ncbi:Adenylosuccinate synthetase [Winogradskyella psychrotolerans RS-3]|uniref:Adenylosuccinate synthetase n=1 Tax=Winogradskyella psychrotolerans RS-3 TaxID=641526 RepID=S7VYF5_9FLAO|nr:adenylosuccinate synthetase [Winogradskyella psychrotolerans]EPR74472.1 Adenylosuccinate synthetase [Winogradskyella psychrotolerans RS-3]
MTKCSLVIDLGFGDAGKGLITDFLASQHPEQSLVVRFSGGHQIGHTVSTEALTHTFSNFGSGTFLGVPTYYSEHTTLFPPAILSEGEFLKKYKPKLYCHPLAMITTIYDIAYNRALEKQQHHGSCGLGFGTTIARNNAEIFFYANDLQFEWVVKQRLKSIKNYYETCLESQPKEVQTYYKNELKDYNEDYFIDSCSAIQKFYSIALLSDLEDKFEHFIFEGSQGILLDTQHGFHPHTTWSYTSSKNAIQLIKTHLKTISDIDIFYVTRCYQTRHGNGPMNETAPVILQNSENEANITNEFQGVFRTQALDAELLNYALSCDAIHHQDLHSHKHLVLTCLDQLAHFSYDKLLQKLDSKLNTLYGSYGPRRECIQKLSD